MSKSEGYVDKEIISVQSPCLGFADGFCELGKLRGMSPGIPYSIVQHLSTFPGSACSSARCSPNCLSSPTQIPSSIQHPTLFVGALQVADASFQVPLPKSLSSLEPFFSSSLSWFLDFFWLDDVSCDCGSHLTILAKCMCVWTVPGDSPVP